MRGDQFTLHGTIQGMHDDVRHDVLMLQPTTLDALRKVANVADASTRRHGGATSKSSVQLADLAALMAQLWSGGAHPPADSGTDVPEGVWWVAGHPGATHAHIILSMNRMRVRMLCDTGAVCNCMSRAFYEKYMTSTTSLIPHKGHRNIVTANDSTLTTVGKVRATFKVGGCLLSADFYVFDKLTQDVILGMNFFERSGALLNYKHKRLMLYDGMVSVTLVTAIDPTLAVCTTRRTRIPARHEALIPVTTSGICNACWYNGDPPTNLQNGASRSQCPGRLY